MVELRGGAPWERPILIAMAALLGVGFVASEQTRREELKETRKIADSALEAASAARAEARAALAAIIAPDTLSNASGSVYVILVNGAPRGTAFVIDRARGLLATAAHTAESLPLGGDASVVILNRATRTPIPVVGRKIHGGYGAFRQVIEAYQPIRKSSSIYDPQAAPIRDLAFDAALLRVDPIDPATKMNRLGPDLPLAPEDKLLALGPGSPIAVIGYPYDTLDSGITPEAAISRAERGVISAMIAPLDSAAEVENHTVANLIIHRLSTAGGSSGSPLLNADGEVVGLHTHGVESTASNGDSAAQRADVLFDLLSDAREQRRLAEVFIPAWKHTLTNWARADEVLPWSFYTEYAAPGQKPEPLVGSLDFKRKPPFARSIAPETFAAATDRYVVAAPDLSGENEAGGFVLKERGEYSGSLVKVDRRENVVLFAYDYSMRQRNAACRLTTYFRKVGDTRLAVHRDRASFELHLPALPDGGSEDYQIIHRRSPDCDPASRQFFSGRVVWSQPNAAQAAQSRKSVTHLAQVAHSTINKALSCALQSENPDCREVEYVDYETNIVAAPGEPPPHAAARSPGD